MDVKGEDDGEGGDMAHPSSTTLAGEEGERVERCIGAGGFEGGDVGLEIGGDGGPEGIQSRSKLERRSHRKHTWSGKSGRRIRRSSDGWRKYGSR